MRVAAAEVEGHRLVAPRPGGRHAPLGDPAVGEHELPRSALAPLGAEAAGERMAAALRDAGTVRTVVMHPFLMLDEPWRGQAELLLEALAAGDARVLSGGELASSRVGS